MFLGVLFSSHINTIKNDTNMQEELTTFETAKLAKEKGFNEKCNHLYCIGYGYLKEDKNVRVNYVFDDQGTVIGTSLRTVGKGQPHLALSPTQALLQRWLREVHDILVYVDPRSHHIFQYHIIIDDDEIIGSERLSNWEQTLEKGLLHALQLIKNK